MLRKRRAPAGDGTPAGAEWIARPGFRGPGGTTHDESAASEAGANERTAAASSRVVVVRRAKPCAAAELRRRAWMAGSTSPVTDRAGREHDVSSDEISAGLVAGVYRSLCGVLIAPAALASSAGVPCPACVLELDPVPETAAGDPHVQRRAMSAWLRRLPGRLGGPSGVPSLTAVGGLG